MRKLGVAGAILYFAMITEIVSGQGSAPATLASRTPSQPSASTAPVKAPFENPSSENEPPEKPKETTSPTPAEEPIITEIYADQTVFDSTKSIGIFNGNVVVPDPRFNLQG